MPTFGSTPQFGQSGLTPGPKAVYHSNPDIALIKDKTIKAGFGAIAAGTIMAIETVNNQLVPCAPTAVDVLDNARVFLTATVTAAAIVFVPLDKSYRFAVGDEVVIADNVPAYTDGGAITAIDRDTYPGLAEITFTNVATATMANQANIYHKAGTATKLSLAAWICDQAVMTGEGVDALGANTSVVISNAMLYKSALVGYDAAAATALGMVEDGVHVILK